MQVIALVSACLIGVNCRYDGRNSQIEPEKVEQWLEYLVPVCPEQLGGLPTPRTPANIVGGDGFDVLDGKARVVNTEGKDVTSNFIAGAYETLKIARILGVQICYFKDRSPSCGLRIFYGEDGNSCGIGVTAALLIREKFSVIEVKSTHSRYYTHG